MAVDRVLDTVEMHVPKFGGVVTVNASDVDYWRAQGGTLAGEAPIEPIEPEGDLDEEAEETEEIEPDLKPKRPAPTKRKR